MFFKTNCELNKGDLITIFLMVISAITIRLYFLQFYEVISADGIAYVDIAKNIKTGNGFSSMTHFPPLYPMLTALATYNIKDFEAAGLFVSLIMGSLMVIPVYLLGAEFFSKRAGIVVAIITISWPSMISCSNVVASQATYLTLDLLAIYFIWRAYKKHSVWLAVSGGAFFALAYLTRPEGMLVFSGITAVLLMIAFTRRLPASEYRCIIIGWCVFLVLIFPYLYFLHELTGRWQLTGKSSATLADALGGYLGKPDLKYNSAFKEIGYLDLFRLYPDYLSTNYLKNIKLCWQEMLPVYGWIVASIGFLSGGWKGDKLSERMYLLATFTPLMVIIIFFFVTGYDQQYLPVLFLWAGQGIVSLENAVKNSIRVCERNSYERLSWYIVLSLVVFYSAFSLLKQIPAGRNEPYDYTRDEGRLDDKHIGLKLASLLPKDAVIMTRSGRIGYYSKLKYVMPPQADYADILDYAKKSRVDFIIATLQLLDARPQLKFLYGPLLAPKEKFSPPPELELVYFRQEPGGLPYFVYRIKK